jgi:hypothetical protein
MTLFINITLPVCSRCYSSHHNLRRWFPTKRNEARLVLVRTPHHQPPQVPSSPWRLLRHQGFYDRTPRCPSRRPFLRFFVTAKSNEEVMVQMRLFGTHLSRNWRATSRILSSCLVRPRRTWRFGMGEGVSALWLALREIPVHFMLTLCRHIFHDGIAAGTYTWTHNQTKSDIKWKQEHRYSWGVTRQSMMK